MERKQIRIGENIIGDGNPVFIIAEIGINHNADMNLAKKLIDMAIFAECNAVKFQKRNPNTSTPENQKNKLRETPWGEMTYLEYKHRIEFGEKEYKIIDEFARDMGILWFASPWDEDSVDFLEKFNVPCYKIASACLTDHGLLKKIKGTNKPIILSTGMSNDEQIDSAIEVLGGTDNLAITHSISTYPARPFELNLRGIKTLRKKYDCPIGYSGHEVGLQTTLAAVALGATIIERHITLDRTLWGTDQAASVEPFGLLRLVRDIRVIEQALGDGKKRIFPSEIPIMEKLRRRDDTKRQKFIE
ncbi:MAG: N-acetylneuraminate synthase family protein [Candidatus Hodarchaeales archaeon]|jgi:N-acetylneuraminate synthase